MKIIKKAGVLTAPTTLPSFTLSDPSDAEIIRMIALRACALDSSRSLMDVEMDIVATHVNGCPLQLSKLMLADDFNFQHDVCGIHRHLDRSTGALMNFFYPRYRVKEG